MESVATYETLTRFVMQSNWFRSSDRRVKYAAFMPNLRNGETSVFRISDLSDVEVWAIGDDTVATLRERPILGRADITASLVMANKLNLVPDEPPPRHANIVGWPQDKERQRIVALELASEDVFHERQPS
jgi:hypothetical protein